jgi:hypothetical protein
MPTLDRFGVGRGTLRMQPFLSPCRKCTSIGPPGTEIGSKPLFQQAPASTFDGTLISDMSFGTLMAQVVPVSNLPMWSADNPRYFKPDCGWPAAYHSAAKIAE